MRPGFAGAFLTAAALSASGCGRASSAPAVTFNKDVAPIVFANCVTCHRPGEVAPFSLLTYADAVKHAGKIADETRERRMPPWLPERGEFPILGDRRLRDDQVDIIQRWVAGGKIEGNAADLPKPPAPAGGWQLGPPDQVLPGPRPYTRSPRARDVYRNLRLLAPLQAAGSVRAVGC